MRSIDRRSCVSFATALATAVGLLVAATPADAQLQSGYAGARVGEAVVAWPNGSGTKPEACTVTALLLSERAYMVRCPSGEYALLYYQVGGMSTAAAEALGVAIIPATMTEPVKLARPTAGAPALPPGLPATKTPVAAPGAGGTAAGLPGYETGVIGEIVKAWPTGIGGWSDECRILNRHDGGYDLSCNKGEFFVPYRWVARMSGPGAPAKPNAQPADADDEDEPAPVIPQLTKGTYRCYDDDDRYTRQNVVLTSKTAYKDRRGRSGRYRQNDDLLTFTSGPYKGWDASVDEEGAITLTDPKTDVTTTCRKG